MQPTVLGACVVLLLAQLAHHQVHAASWVYHDYGTTHISAARTDCSLTCSLTCSIAGLLECAADAVQSFTLGIVARCGAVASAFELGKSVQGRSLIGLNISLANDTRVPEIGFVANMHGDETVGRESVLWLAEYLCDQYLAGSLTVRTMLTRTRIFLIPSLNPDGFESRRRENANNVDLNRDFPDQFVNAQPTLESLQPETRAYMSWASSRTLCYMLSLHGGDFVVSYPWDGRQDGGDAAQVSRAPDDELYYNLAVSFSHAHATMSQLSSFADGVTNGAAWYPLYGGMQDWSIVRTGAASLTPELSTVKYIDEAQLDGAIGDTYPAYLAAIGIVQRAVSGTVMDAAGQPLAARCLLVGLEDGIVARTSADGYFHRLALPGSYDVQCSADNYVTGFARAVVDSGQIQTQARLSFVLLEAVVAARDVPEGQRKLNQASVVFLACFSLVGFVISSAAMVLLVTDNTCCAKRRRLAQRVDVRHLSVGAYATEASA